MHIKDWDWSFIFGAAFVLFCLWAAFGGLLEKPDNSNSVYIDCTQPGYSHSPYCNGDYDSQAQAQDAGDNSYYQNIAR